MALTLPEVMRFDAALKLGDEVIARWTWGGGYYEGKGKVSKLNAKSIKIELGEDVSGPFSGWPKGQEMMVPRALFGNMTKWSWNNGVFPVVEAN